jgi:hypothetical protein
MNHPTLLKLDDVEDLAPVRISLPAPLHIGSRLKLRFPIQRRNGGRTEVLNVDGEFKVTSVLIDARGGAKQLISVAAVGAAPTWKSIKNPAIRKLNPTSRVRIKKTEVT